MEKEKRDFYQEALKAFDAPIPLPKKEEPAIAPTAKEAKPAPQEKPKRKSNPWWAVALCALLSLALVIGLGRNDGDAVRGEHYLYGTLEEFNDQYMILHRHGINYYVELSGLEVPKDLPKNTGIWVFYNGEPEELEADNLQKKVFATYWKADTNVADQIQFDLDGDGKEESWSFTHSVSEQDVYALNSQIKLVAKNEKGELLHHVSIVAPPATQSAVFSNKDGKLCIVISRLNTYEELSMRIEDGVLSVLRNGEPLKLIPDHNEPENPETEKPTLGHQENYSLLFYLKTGPMSDKLRLSAGDAHILRTQLDALAWEDAWDETYKINWGFNFYTDDQADIYNFSKGFLLHDGKKAKIGTELTENLMDLMGRKIPPEQDYYGYLSNGEQLSIIFYNSGMVKLDIADQSGNKTRAYTGRYATIGDWYLLDLGEAQRHILVLKQKDHSMEYVPACSDQTMFAEPQQLEFYKRDSGGTLAVALRCLDGSWESSVVNAALPVQTVSALRQKLQNCDWQSGISYTADEIVGRFTLYDGVEEDMKNPQRYYLLTGGRLLREVQEPGGKETIATLDPILWHLLAGLFSRNGEQITASYTAETADGLQIVLELKNSGTFQLDSWRKGQDDEAYSVLGYYTYLGEVLVLMGLDEELTCIRLEVRNGKLLYNAARSTPNQAFGQAQDVTLFELQVGNYQRPTAKFVLVDPNGNGNFSYLVDRVNLSDEMAAAASLLMQSLQWEEMEAVSEESPEVPHIGWFRFPMLESWGGPFDVCVGMRLVYGDTYEAKLTHSQWQTVCAIMAAAGEAVHEKLPADANGTVYSLLLDENKSFWLAKEEELQAEHISGTYCMLQNEVIVCYGSDGQMFALRQSEEGWRLLSDYNFIETFDIPDGTIFGYPIVDGLPEEQTPAA